MITRKGQYRLTKKVKEQIGKGRKNKYLEKVNIVEGQNVKKIISDFCGSDVSD